MTQPLPSFPYGLHAIIAGIGSLLDEAGWKVSVKPIS